MQTSTVNNGFMFIQVHT